MANGKGVVEVVVTGGRTSNSLGLIRGFGRRGIPVTYLDTEPGSFVRYSRYIRTRLKCPGTKESEDQFIRALLDYGEQKDGRMVVLPTNDRDVMALSKHKRELGKFYLLPVPEFEIVQKLVDKKRFYKLLAEMQIPHPKTYFPENLPELQAIGRQIAYPYIVKPAHTKPFQDEFGRKCFVVDSPQECERAVSRLKGKNLEVMLQDIVPGKDIYMAYMYLNQESELLAVCGYDKLRQNPPDFGSGSLCKTAWKPVPIDIATQVLTTIGYHGIAEPEFKLDPRDGTYKLLEINARTSSENRLAAECGADIEYTAYLDVTGRGIENLAPPRNGILWVDDFNDLLSCWKQLRQGKLGIREIYRSLKGAKIHSVAAWDDIVPFLMWLLPGSRDKC